MIIESADVSPVVAAEVFKPAGSLDGGALRSAKKGKILWDSGVVAAGAIISACPILDTTGIEHITVFVINAGGAATRTLRLWQYLADGVTAFGSSLATRIVATGASEWVVFGPGASTPAGTQVYGYPMVVPPFLKFQLDAGGAVDGRIVIYGR
jgi:hypothetical protein